ncbi:MAG: chromate transporter, partial [Myxococcales bacterium]|nr:chromate transporter [Myxococcales bacterium]
ELAVLAVAGVFAALGAPRSPRAARSPAAPPGQGPPSAAPSYALAAAAAGTGGALSFGLGALFVTFLKIGSVLFGSGYVLVAFLRSDLVDRLGWLTEAQLLDAVTAGQVTPGPVFTTATFVGYLLGGVPAAAVATVGIFLPAFVLVAASGPLVARVRRSPRAGAFLDGVTAASLALMAVVALELGGAAVVDPFTAIVGLVSFAVLARLRPNPTWLVLGGALAGVLASGVLGAR